MGFCFVWLLHGIMFVIRNQKRSQNFADVPQLLGITSVCNSTVECYDLRLSTSTTDSTAIEKKVEETFLARFHLYTWTKCSYISNR